MSVCPPVPVTAIRADGYVPFWVQREAVTYIEKDSHPEHGLVLRVHFIGGTSLLMCDDARTRASLGLPAVETIGGRQAKRGLVERERGRDGA